MARWYWLSGLRAWWADSFCQRGVRYEGGEVFRYLPRIRGSRTRCRKGTLFDPSITEQLSSSRSGTSPAGFRDAARGWILGDQGRGDAQGQGDVVFRPHRGCDPVPRIARCDAKHWAKGLADADVGTRQSV